MHDVIQDENLWEETGRPFIRSAKTTKSWGVRKGLSA